MQFDSIIDFVKTVNRNKVKEIFVLGNPTTLGEETLVAALYDAISKEKVRTEQEAITFLYGKGDNNVAFQHIKRKLVRQLTNTSLFVDVNQPMFNDRQKAYYNCYRDLAAAYVLLSREAMKPGVEILEGLLEQSIKYEFVELTAQIVSQLRRVYSRTIGSASMHERYSKMHREYEEKRRLEMLALEYLENLINYYIVHRSPNEEIHLLATRYYDELYPLIEKADTSQYYFHTTQIGLIKYLSINDCEGALKVCNEALSALMNRKNTNKESLIALLCQKLACLTQLRIFESGDETFNMCLALCEEGHFNWFRTLETYFYYCIYGRRYAEALYIFKLASEHPKFDLLGGAIRDNWILFGGYLHLIAILGHLDPLEVEKIVGVFRYAKLTNEIMVVAKDKQGMNIPLVFLPVIYHIAKGSFDTADISPESLEKYRKRYLDNEMNRRSAAFLNMLIAFTKRDYQSASAEKKIKKEMEILAKEQPQVAGQTFAIEIIPYEDLWEMLITH